MAYALSNHDALLPQQNAAREIAFLLIKHPDLLTSAFALLTTTGTSYFASGQRLDRSPSAFVAWHELTGSPEGIQLANAVQALYSSCSSVGDIENIRGAPAQVLAYLSFQRKYGFYPRSAIECRIDVNGVRLPQNDQRRFDVFGGDEFHGQVLECKCGPAWSPRPSEQRRRLLAQLSELQKVKTLSGRQVQYAFLSYYQSQAALRILNRLLGNPDSLPPDRVVGRDMLSALFLL